MKTPMLHIARHEIRQVLREPKFLLPFLFPPVLLVASQVLFLPKDVSPEILSRMMLFCALLIAPMIVPLASDSFAGERERGSLELLLLLPASPATIFYGKLLALLPLPFFLVVLAEIAYALVSGIFVFSFWWKSVLAGILACLCFSGISLFVSLHVKTARAANQISLVFVFLLLLALGSLSNLYFARPWMPFLLLSLVVILFVALSAISFRKFRKC